MKHYKLSIFYLLLLFSFVSCSKDDNEEVEKDNRANHTVIVYMIGNNNLHDSAIDNINQMESAWNEDFDGHLIVVFEPKSRTKEFYKIEIQKDDHPENISSPVVESYYDKDAINPEEMKAILLNIKEQYPAKHYSLILWSHGSGWLPTYVHPRSSESLRSFAMSDYVEMSIQDLCDAIPSNVFDNILFDACFMGSIECLYEMKDKANYFVASPAEVLSYGFPYQTVIPKMFSDKIDMVDVAKCYMDFYELMPFPENSATIGVVASSQLEELASQTKTLLQNTSQNIKLENVTGIQFYDGFECNIFYDFKDAVKAFTPDNNLFSEYSKQFDKAIIYSNHTDHVIWTYDIWGSENIAVKTCSGISCYVPTAYSPKLNKQYKQYKWYEDSGLELLFDSLQKNVVQEQQEIQLNHTGINSNVATDK